MGFHLGKFVHTENGKFLMSVLLGFGLATLFREVCKGRNCITFHSVALEETKGKIYKYDNKCYKYEIKNAKCDPNKQIVSF
jgi:hypothetical protein